MKRKIIISFFIITISVLVFVGIRYNLTYGNSVKQKTMMVNCMHNALQKNSFTNSKTYCECLLDTFIEQYGEDFLEPSNMFNVTNAAQITTECEALLKAN